MLSQNNKLYNFKDKNWNITSRVLKKEEGTIEEATLNFKFDLT